MQVSNVKSGHTQLPLGCKELTLCTGNK